MLMKISSAEICPTCKRVGSISKRYMDTKCMKDFTWQCTYVMRDVRDLVCDSCNRKWKVARQYKQVDITPSVKVPVIESREVPREFRIFPDNYPCEDISVVKRNVDGTIDCIDAMLIDGCEIKFYDPKIHIGDMVDVMYTTTIPKRSEYTKLDGDFEIIKGE